MTDKDNNANKWSRRSVLKGLGGIPLAGAAWWAGKRFADEVTGKREEILETLNINAAPPPPTGPMAGDPIRVGIIGLGGRGGPCASRSVTPPGIACRTWWRARPKTPGTCG